MAMVSGGVASRALLRVLGRRRCLHISALALSTPRGTDRGFVLSRGEFTALAPAARRSGWTGLSIPGSRLYSRLISPLVKPQEYDVDAWSDTPYLEYIVGLEPEGSTPATSTGGSTLAGVRGDKRPHPGYAARLIRLRIENGAAVKAREAILDEKSYMRDFGRFWIPMVADLMGGPHHHHSLEIFTWMKDHPTVLKSARVMELDRLYSMMISYAGVVGHTMLARSWFDDMFEKGMRKSSQCCNALIIAYAKDNDLDSAMQILHGMKQFSRECPPNAMTYHILIAMFARYHHWQGLEAMVRECRDAGLSPDAITFNTLLHAYAKMGRMDRFESTFQEMERVCRKGDEPFKRSPETFAALLIGYSRLDALDRFHQVLSEMREESSQLPQNIAVPAVEEAAKAHSRTATVEGIEKLIEFVETTPEIASTSAFQSYVVELYAQCGRLEEIENYLGRVIDRKDGSFVEDPAFESMVGAFGRRGVEQPESKAVERVYTIYAKCREAGMELSSHCYESVVLEMARAGSYERMEEVAADMEAAGAKWPAKTLRALLDAYQRSGNDAKVAEMSERLKDVSQEAEMPDTKVAAAC
ncbi:hypothetical protein SELMODRAFT_431017 [Selaginella moellendorffii]|uniref:Pentatricopeptide repeat-containing protein-mitochondrial domain-containing protein n=1 Tax=Selaginella moellendorffii TaxID=88036 RepID=D8TB94_SELML|nr:pentatricopeptide repeat-containing protein At3g06430, chloroplastic [Selaginella moellendorffii]EFJ06076.1 hypothetical protein SELMODRAFT_431017 [Selaginella moellendorffii]|eukprot:XP_002992885.1 pentatricopeptide repeat-containing protein At3g06430, chloroplastic [Selaginella moellendorffii]